MKGPKCYLYKSIDGHLTVDEGYIVTSSLRSGSTAKFYYGPKSCDYTTCHRESGKFHRATLWLPERDGDKARELFIDHYKGCIAEVQRKVAGYEDIIRTLQDGYDVKGETE